MPKQLLSINEAANRLGISTKTLRRWEEKGIISPKRTAGNQRRYSLADLQKADKQSLSINDAAARLGISTKTLRRWETKGIVSPQRTTGNQRRYALSDIEPLKDKTPKTTTVLKRVEKQLPTLEKERFFDIASIKAPQLTQIRKVDAEPESSQTKTEPIKPEQNNHSSFLSRTPVRLGLTFFGLLGLALMLGSFSRYINPAHFIALLPHPNTTKSINVHPDDQVLAAATQNHNFGLKINVPVEFMSTASVAGTLTAPNILYGITAGQNVAISGDPQNPTISTTGVSSLQGQSGAVTLTAGSGISINDLTISATGGNSFENIKVGSSTITAGSSTDTLEFVAGSGISLSSDTTNKKLTINSSSTGTALSGLTTNGVLYADSSTTAVSLTPGTSGYVLQSNGSGSPPSWVLNTASNPSFSAISSGTNTTAAMVVGAGASLTYSGGTATSGVINANQLLGSTWAAPGAIGSTTPSTASFTALSASGAITFSSLLTNGGLLYTNGLGVVTQTGAGSSTTVLHGGTTPSYSAVSLTADVTGTLPIGNGGTNITTYTTGDILYASAANTLSKLGIGSTGQVLSVSGGIPSWATSSSTNYWQLNAGAVIPAEVTNDLLLGATSTASAKFAFTHVAGGTPTASISANSGANALFITGTGNLATTNDQTLTLGGTTTGNIVLDSGVGVVQLADLTTNGVVYTSGSNGTLNSEAQLNVARGGTGVNGSSASNGQLLIGNGSGFSLSTLTAGSGITITNGSGTISIAQSGAGASKWTQDSANGTLYPNISTLDLLVGGISSASAKFAVLNVNSGTPTASLSAGVAGGAYLTADGTLQTTANQRLTLGGSSTGDIYISPRNSSGTLALNVGSITVNGNTGSTSVSPTCVSVTNGIVTGTGACGTGSGGSVWTLNSTNGTLYPINSSLDTFIGGVSTASAKFGFLNVSGGTPTASISAGTAGATFLTADGQLQTTAKQSLTFGGGNTGNIVLSGFGTGLIHSNASGVLSSSAVNLAGSDVTGILPIANGGSPFEQLNGAIIERITTQDLLLGSTATSSSKFAFINVGSGTPTASISANSGNIATTLTGTGILGTTNAQTLTLGNSSTGEVILAPGGTTALTARGANLIASGTLTGLTGLTSSGTITFSSLNANGGVLFTNSSGVITQVNNASTNMVLHGGTSPSFSLVDLANDTTGILPTSKGGSFWNSSSGALYPGNSTLDLLIGGISSPSASFHVFGTSPFQGTNPVASIAANTTFAGLVVDNKGTGDIFTASSSGLTRVVITQNGALRLAGNGTDSFVTPANSSVPTKINIPIYDPGAFGQILAFGLPSGASSTSRGISIFDNRSTSNNQAPLAVFSPDENSLFGLGWDGQSTTGYLKMSGGSNQNLGIKFGANVVTTWSGVDGSTIFQPSANSATALQLENTAGTALFTLGNTGTAPIATIAANTSFAGLVVDNKGRGDLFTASSSGLNRFVITQAGNVGIGTPLPSAQLHITQTSAKTAAFVINSATPVDLGDANTFIVYDNGGTSRIQYSNLIRQTTISGGNSTIWNSAALSVTTDDSGATPLRVAGASNSHTANIFEAYATGTTDRKFAINPSGTSSTASISANTSFAGLVVDNKGTGDIFTASSSGLTRFTINQNGTITIPTYAGSNATLYAAPTTGLLTTATTASPNLCLLSGASTPTWGSCLSGTGTNFFVLNSSQGTLYPVNATLDFLIGGISSASARFHVFGSANLAGTQPVASISGNTSAAGLIIDNRGTGDLFTASSSGLNRFVIAQNGNVGIGTALPTAKLDISYLNGPNAISISNQSAAVKAYLTEKSNGETILSNNINISDVLDSSAKSAWKISLSGNDALDAFELQTITAGSGTWTGFRTPFIVKNNGLSGFNATTPLATLDIRGSTIAGGTVPIASLSGQTSFAGLVVDNSGAGDLFTASSSGLSRFVIAQNGNVGIGTVTPNNLLHLSQVNGAGDVAIRIQNNAVTANETTSLIFTNSTTDTATHARIQSQRVDANGSRLFLATRQNGSPSNVLELDEKGRAGFGTSTLLSSLDIQPNNFDGGTISVASISGKTSFAGLIVDNRGTGDLFTASSSGLNRFVITQAGNVGIGTATPTTLLSVGTTATMALLLNNSVSTADDPYSLGMSTGASNSQRRFTLASQEGGNQQALQFGDGVTTDSIFGIGSSADTGATWNPRFIIKQNGNIGIGTNSPISSLDIRGNLVNGGGTIAVASVSGRTSFAGLVVDNSGAGDLFTASSSGLPRFSISQNGNVRIGKNPGAGSNIPAVPASSLEILSDKDPVSGVGTNANYPLILWSSLAANGTGTGIAFANTNDPGNIGASIIFNRTGGQSQGELEFYTKQSTTLGVAPVQAMVISNNGSVGIGSTSPTSELYVTRPLTFGTTGKALAVFDQIENQDIFAASASGTNRFVITNSGNVGIGTTSPNSLLNVSGTGGFGANTSGQQLAMFKTTSTGNSAATISLLADSSAFDISKFTSGASPANAVTFNNRDNAPMIFYTNNTEAMRIAANNHVLIGTTTDSGKTLSVGSPCTNTGTNSCVDYAEFYNASEIVSPAEIVSLDTASSSGKLVRITTEEYDRKAIGIAATNPAFVIEEGHTGIGGSEGAVAPSTKPPVALAGRVPVKVSTINGALAIGDYVTSSDLKGHGMKATKVGTVVGKAMQDFDPANGKTGEGLISCPAGTPAGVICGQIFVFVNTSWHDPDIYLTSTGNISIFEKSGAPALESASAYGVKNADGSEVIRSGIFSEAVVGKLKTGSLDVQSLTLGGTNINDKLLGLENGVASFSAGFASPIAGLQTQVLSLSDRVASLEAKLSATDSAMLNFNLAGFTASSGAELNLDKLDVSGSIISDRLSVISYATVNDLSVNGTFTAGLLQIKGLDNGGSSISTLNGDLKLQNQGYGGIDILNGMVTVDTSGNVDIQKTLTAKVVKTNKLEIISDPSSTLSASTGSGIIASGTNSTIINSTAVTDKSLIYITFGSDYSPATRYWIKTRTAGQSFTVKLDQNVTNDAKFNWWIIN